MKKLFYLLLLPLILMTAACDKEDDMDHDYEDPDYVMPDFSGTSIGSMLGALYAAGYKADELEEFFVNLDENDAKSSSKIREILSKLLQDKGVTTFEDLKIPFRCVVKEII